MNKQIEEMAKVIYKEFGTMVVAEADATAIAVHLTRKSYRKSTDVAKEIFADVEKVIRKHYKLPQYDLMYDIYKLKKKYESEGTDNERAD